MNEIVYVSAARKPFDTTQLNALLEHARRNNERLGVTGILLYDEGSFIQLLEGDPQVLHALYAQIAADPRHYRVRVVRERVIAARSFGAWTMGYVSIDPKQVLLGRHSLRSNGSLFEDDPRTLELLDAFRGGQWRSYILG
ncbi:MAG TPA: BLUF domain-containing protein [Polyangiales bacterium]